MKQVLKETRLMNEEISIQKKTEPERIFCFISQVCSVYFLWILSLVNCRLLLLYWIFSQ